MNSLTYNLDLAQFASPPGPNRPISFSTSEGTNQIMIPPTNSESSMLIRPGNASPTFGTAPPLSVPPIFQVPKLSQNNLVGNSDNGYSYMNTNTASSQMKTQRNFTFGVSDPILRGYSSPTPSFGIEKVAGQPGISTPINPFETKAGRLMEVQSQLPPTLSFAGHNIRYMNTLNSSPIMFNPAVKNRAFLADFLKAVQDFDSALLQIDFEAMTKTRTKIITMLGCQKLDELPIEQYRPVNIHILQLIFLDCFIFPGFYDCLKNSDFSISSLVLANGIDLSQSSSTLIKVFAFLDLHRLFDKQAIAMITELLEYYQSINKPDFSHQTISLLRQFQSLGHRSINTEHLDRLSSVISNQNKHLDLNNASEIALEKYQQIKLLFQAVGLPHPNNHLFSSGEAKILKTALLSRFYRRELRQKVSLLNKLHSKCIVFGDPNLFSGLPSLEFTLMKIKAKPLMKRFFYALRPKEKMPSMMLSQRIVSLQQPNFLRHYYVMKLNQKNTNHKYRHLILTGSHIYLLSNYTPNQPLPTSGKKICMLIRG